MAEKKDLRGSIMKMREVAQLLTGWADDMESSLEAGKKKKAEAAAEPAAPPAADLTYEGVRGVLSAKCAAGFRAQVQAVINSFGAEKLSGVAPEHYPALLEMVADLGGEDHAG